MSSASRRHTRARVRNRTVTRPNVEGLEARSGRHRHRSLRLELGRTGPFRPAGRGPTLKAETAGSAAGQRPAVTHQVRSPVIDSLPASTAPKDSDGRRSWSAAVSPISSQESAVGLDPRWSGTQGPAEAAWDRTGTPDTPRRAH